MLETLVLLKANFDIDKPTWTILNFINDKVIKY